MATQKQLKQRIKSIRTIIKVTKAMKLVAAARTKAMHLQLLAARQFQEDIGKLLAQTTDKRDKNDKWVMMPITSDRGLCGSVNSVIVREARAMYREHGGENSKMICIGAKCIGGLQRQYASDILFGISEQKPGKRMTFKHVCAITEMFRAADWVRADVLYNRFKNAVTFIPTSQPFSRFDPKAPTPKSLAAYEEEGDQDIIRNLDEFRMAASLWQIYAESESSELNSRVNAMENSNKSAREMAEKLAIKANKLRQAQITLEICDIVAGAESAM
jgi:F-type H+-transporting ATPase subunit gamma